MRCQPILLLCFLFFAAAPLLAQEQQLAQQYYVNGEYEKAAVLYEQLYESTQRNEYYFNRFIDCLTALKEYDRCEDIIKKELKRDGEQTHLYVTYGGLFDAQNKEAEAKEQYEKAIKKMADNQIGIIRVATAFTNANKLEYAVRAYERGGELLKNNAIFAYNLGELYRRIGDMPKMIESYLNSLDENPTRMNSLMAIFQRNFFGEEDYLELQKQLYARMNTNKDAIHYPEMLAWVFIQRKDYMGALRQAKALDKRLDENGARVFRLAEIAANDTDWSAAIEAYSYVVNEKGVSTTFYVDAKKGLLRCSRNRLVDGYQYTEEDLRNLEAQYQAFLDEFGQNSATAPIVMEMADLEALYLNDINKAISLLQALVLYPGIAPNLLAEAKLSLADFYLIEGDVWESTLLYSQVDKAMSEDALGHEARYRNARLSYFNGDFEWAQAQFDVLKASTSKLISNNAIDMSVFIMDNMGLDTTTTALMLYAEAELLIFQNRMTEAVAKLDSLKTGFPKHTLKDDVLWAESQIAHKKRDYTLEASLLEDIITNHKEEIRADNALFALAELNEKQLKNVDKAMALYEQLFIDFSGSTFAVEARKRFRLLRGDNI